MAGQASFVVNSATLICLVRCLMNFSLYQEFACRWIDLDWASPARKEDTVEVDSTQAIAELGLVGDSVALIKPH